VISLISFILILDILLVFFLGSINGIVLMWTLLPLTFFNYAVLLKDWYKFSSGDTLSFQVGKLFFFTKATFQSTVIAVLNSIMGGLLIPESSFRQLEFFFGIYAPIFYLVLLPIPGMILLSLKSNEYQKIYELIYQNLIDKENDYEFIELTTRLITIKDKYSDNYKEQLEKVRESIFKFLMNQFPQTGHFFDPEEKYKFNLENLAIFLTKRKTGLPE